MFKRSFIFGRGGYINFIRLINTIESELAMEYWPGAIAWCDENFGEAWSNAIERFEKSLSSSLDRNDFNLIAREKEIYMRTILDLMRKYKAYKKIDDIDSFLKTIQ